MQATRDKQESTQLRKKQVVGKPNKMIQPAVINHKFNKRQATMLTILLIAALHAGSVSSWRTPFDLPATPDNRATYGILGGSMPSIYGNLQLASNQMLSPSNHQRQIITPNNQVAPQYIAAAQDFANSLNFNQAAISNPSLPTTTTTAAWTTTSTTTTTTTTTPRPSQQADEPKSSSSSLGADLAKSIASAMIAPRSSSDQETAASVNSTINPSPLGKILANLAESGSASQPIANSSSPADKLNVAMQVLKPRKVPQSESSTGKQTVSATQQQIINQHARPHAPTQRISPTKHRDVKLVSQLLSSSSESSSSSPSYYSSWKESPLYSIIFGGGAGGAGSSSSGSSGSNDGDFKSTGITSRSSIVKAISDNKLARTLTTVGKTLSGNKYVAGAAAASALAALGLTVSKLLGPYMFAGSYSKLGDPMIGSGSMLSPNFLNTDRNYYSSEPLINSASSQNSRLPQGGYMSASSLPPGYSFSGDLGDQMMTPSFTNYPPMSYFTDQQTTPNNQVYVTYEPKAPQSSLVSSSMPSRFSSSSTRNPPMTNLQGTGEAAGHYSEFYAKVGPTSAVEPEFQFQSSQFGPQESSLNEQFQRPQQQSNFASTTNNNYDQSDNAAMYIQRQPIQVANKNLPRQHQQQQHGLYSSATSRRSGAVALKMDEATRAKLYQQLQERYLLEQQQQEQQQASASSVSPTNSFVPMIAESTDYGLVGMGAQTPRQPQGSGVDLTNGGNRNHAPVAASKFQQQQQGQLHLQPIAGSPTTHLLIRPNQMLDDKRASSNVPPPLSSSSSSSATSEVRLTNDSPSNKPIESSESSNSAWRSLDSGPRSPPVSPFMVRVMPPQLLMAQSNKQTPVNNQMHSGIDINGAAEHSASGNIQRGFADQAQSDDDDPQSPPSRSTADERIATGESVPVNDVAPQENSSHLLQRFSRTPVKQSSVKGGAQVTVERPTDNDNHDAKTANSPKATTTGGFSSMPQVASKADEYQRDSSSDLSLATTDGSNSISAAPPANKYAINSNDRNEISIESGNFKLAPLAKAGGARLGGFVQLENYDNNNNGVDSNENGRSSAGDDDKNNVIKFIEAASRPPPSEANKLTTSRSSHLFSNLPTVLILPKSRPPSQMAGHSTSISNGSTNNGIANHFIGRPDNAGGQEDSPKAADSGRSRSSSESVNAKDDDSEAVPRPFVSLSSSSS